MTKEGDFLTCKKTFYVNDFTLLNKIKNRIFSKPIFKKKSKYKIEKIDECITNDNQHFEVYYIKIYFTTLIIDFDVSFPKQFIDKYFYTENDIRKIKLKKLKL